ncbi:Methyl-accepting chemotaxis protein I (serine chemoreceptor protein) [hydrothermal vent metagenome]|uniref:Methyl-accepting chemotaxis protein I (Serine chemoreceptor protein) n=1 Tax=hydrothermal vent metagenome TaxID=652676 RepID=A0A3B1C5S8_9ZZZZ
MKKVNLFVALIISTVALGGVAFSSSSLPGLNPDTSLPGLGPGTSPQAPLDTTVSTHLPPIAHVEPAASTHGAAPAVEHGGAAVEHGAIKAVKVSLADRETIKILETNWLKEAGVRQTAVKEEGFSGVFWVVIGIFVVFIVGGAGLVFSGVFNKYGLNLKLYSSHGSLAVLAIFLGVISFVYITRLMDMSELEAGFLDLDMMASETMVYQNNFLLHGIENKEYGDRQVEHIKKLIEKFRADASKLRENKFIDSEMVGGLSQMETDIGQYGKDLKEVVSAYHDVEEMKEKMAELSEKAEEALKEMGAHHRGLLARAEAQGNAGETTYQNLVVEHLAEAEVEILKVSLAEVEFLLDKSPKLVETMQSHMGIALAFLGKLEGELKESGEKKTLGEVEREIEEYTQELMSVIKDEAEIMRDTSEMTGLIHDVEAAGSELSHKAKTMLASTGKEAEIMGIFLGILALVLGTSFAILVTRSISKPITTIVENLSEGSAQVAAASGQISESSQSLAEGATEQASALEETSSSLEEISSMVKQNADNSGNANTLMIETKEMVETGVHSMKSMVIAMDSIKDSSGEISKIIKVIEEIAFQTNLLALNAAVEAARAGEHGKGFAVVAEEVRNLAQRSANASKDTASLIENAVKKSEEGGQIVKKASDALEGISESARKVGDLVGEISAASNEQAQGVNQVSEAVNQMDQVTQMNASNAEETAAASEELNAQADSMDGVVTDLSSLVNGMAQGGAPGKRQSSAPKALPMP